MSTVARQLFQLQELELAIEANEQKQMKLTSQLGDSQDVLKMRADIVSQQKQIEDFVKQQKTTEWEADDLSTKIKNIEKKLYDGKITNSKELSSLQTEAQDFKKNRSKLEDKVLELMEQTDSAQSEMAASRVKLKQMEEKWQDQQKQINRELEQLMTDHVDLNARKQNLLPEIEPDAIEIYKDLRKRRGTAVARIGQGICMGCRITLPNSDLQQAKGGGLARCSSCGRILYLP